MEIEVVIAVPPEQADPDDETGLTEEGFMALTNAVGHIGEIVSIEKRGE